MTCRLSKPRRLIGFVLSFGVAAIFGLSLSLPALAQKFEIKSVAEKKIQQLPAGTLFWRIDNFPTLAQARAAAGPAALAAEVAGKVWLFTLGPKGGSSPGGSKIAEMGPCRRSLRLNICYASTVRVGRLASRRPFIHIRGPKPFTC